MSDGEACALVAVLLLGFGLWGRLLHRVPRVLPRAPVVAAPSRLAAAPRPAARTRLGQVALTVPRTRACRTCRKYCIYKSSTSTSTRAVRVRVPVQYEYTSKIQYSSLRDYRVASRLDSGKEQKKKEAKLEAHLRDRLETRFATRGESSANAASSAWRTSRPARRSNRKHSVINRAEQSTRALCSHTHTCYEVT